MQSPKIVSYETVTSYILMGLNGLFKDVQAMYEADHRADRQICYQRFLSNYGVLARYLQVHMPHVTDRSVVQCRDEQYPGGLIVNGSNEPVDGGSDV